MEGFLNPEDVLKQLKLKKDMTAADFGSGSGGWAIPLAKKLEEGKVYAIDILEEPLSALRSKALLEKVFNIKLILADVEKDIDLPKESLDIILMTNLLFQVDDKKKVLEQGKKFLKKGGKILIVDWEQSAPLGPKEGRVSSEEIKILASEIGLKLENEFPAGSQHYGLIFTKL
jgi:ubiquinone/menaquinone biosynthesis C-methylase UbiE